MLSVGYIDIIFIDIYFVFLLYQGSEFLRGFHSADHGRFADAWDEIQRPQVLPSSGGERQAHLAQVENEFRSGTGSQLQQTLDGNTS